MINNRLHPRFAIELDAQVIVGDLCVAGRTRDISRGGFCMLAQGQVPTHTRCEIRLSLVFSHNEFSEQLSLPATVVWCTPLKQEQAYQVGIKFGELDAQTLGYLNLFVNFLDSEEDDGDDDPITRDKAAR
jgi:hypothetical protein